MLVLGKGSRIHFQDGNSGTTPSVPIPSEGEGPASPPCHSLLNIDMAPRNWTRGNSFPPLHTPAVIETETQSFQTTVQGL